jgi:hypothetical protein
MEPRVRAGVIAGAGSAIAIFFLSFLFFCLPGPFIAAIGGFNAGMQVGRNPQYAARAGNAGANAGLYAGLIIAVAQIAGMLLAVVTLGTSFQDQIMQTYPAYTVGEIWGVLIALSVIVGLLDLGIAVGLAAWGATWAAQRTASAQKMAAPVYMPMPPVNYEPPPPLAAQLMPPPPAVYPPPPSYYGLPDAPPPDQSPPDATEK